MKKSAEELNASLDRTNNVNPRSSLRRDSQYGSAPQFKVELTDLQKTTPKPTSPASSDEPSPTRASPSSEDESLNGSVNNNNNATLSQPGKDDKGKEEDIKVQSADQSEAPQNQEEGVNHKTTKPVASHSLQEFCLFSSTSIDLNNITAAKIMRLKKALLSNTRAPIITTLHVNGGIVRQLTGFTRGESHTRMRDAMNKQYLEALKHLVVCSKKGDKKAEAILSELKQMFQDLQEKQLDETTALFLTKELLKFDIEKLWLEAKILKTTVKANKFYKIQESIECNEAFLRKKLLIIIAGLNNLAENGDNKAAAKLSQFMATFCANEVSRLKTLEANKLKAYENFYNIPRICEKLVKKFTYEDTLLQQAIDAYIQDSTQCRLSPFFRQIFALTMIYSYAHKNATREAKFGPLITGEPLVVTNLKSKFAAATKIDFNEHNVWEFMLSIKKDLTEALSTYIGYRKSHTIKSYAQHNAVNEQLIKDIEMLIAWVSSTDVRFDAEIDSDDADLLVLSPQSALSAKKNKTTEQPTSPETSSTPLSPWMDFGGLEEETTPVTPVSPWMDFGGFEEDTPKMTPVSSSPPAMQPVFDSESDNDEDQNNGAAEEYSSDDSNLSI